MRDIFVKVRLLYLTQWLAFLAVSTFLFCSSVWAQDDLESEQAVPAKNNNLKVETKDSEKNDDEPEEHLERLPGDIKPPAIPQIPTPPAVTLPDSGKPIVIKETLAWRAQATAMAIEYPFNEKNGACWTIPIAYDKAQLLLRQALQQSNLEIASQYSDAGQYLINTPSPGTTLGSNNTRPSRSDVSVGAGCISPRVDAIDPYNKPNTSGAGGTQRTLIAGADAIRPCPPSPRQAEIIIISQPAGTDKTLFRLRIFSTLKAADNKKISALPALMQDLLANRGLWQ